MAALILVGVTLACQAPEDGMTDAAQTAGPRQQQPGEDAGPVAPRHPTHPTVGEAPGPNSPWHALPAQHAEMLPVVVRGRDGGAQDAAGGGDGGQVSHAFLVYAPYADNVSVAGTWNAFTANVDPLTRGLDGTWTGTVNGAAPGHEYQFVIERAGRAQWRSDPRARQVTNSAGKSRIYEDDSFGWSSPPFSMPAKNDLVIYEMHIGTFNDVAGGRPGTWSSAAEKLGALVDLGVNAVEVMPPAEFAGDFSWGYNTAFPFAPESAYGSPDDMKRFIDQAHARGLAVIIDVVHNHWGPTDLSMWCLDGNCLGQGNGGAYFYADWRRETGWGPRPDYGRAPIREFITDNALFWLDAYRADGLRWDSTLNIRSANGVDIPEGWGLMQHINDLVDQRHPNKILIAEDLQNNEWLTKTTGAGGAGFDAQWEAGFFHPVDDNLIVANDADRNLDAIKNAIVSARGDRQPNRVVYTESHDEVANGRQRIPAMINPADPASNPSKKRSLLGAVLVMTSPGIPMLFQGQEFLEDGWFADTRPLDWTKADRFSGITAAYKALIAVRRNLAGHTQGLRGAGVQVHHLNQPAKVMAYHRFHNGGVGDDVVVIANFANRAFPGYDVGVPAPGRWFVRVNTDDIRYDSSFSGVGPSWADAAANPMDGQPARLRVALGPYAALILSQ